MLAQVNNIPDWRPVPLQARHRRNGVIQIDTSQTQGTSLPVGRASGSADETLDGVPHLC
jgi:hypothetical protein